MRQRPYIEWSDGKCLTALELAVGLKNLNAPDDFTAWAEGLQPNMPVREALPTCPNRAWLTWLYQRLDVNTAEADHELERAMAPVMDLLAERDEEARLTFQGNQQGYQNYMGLMQEWARSEYELAQRQYIESIYDNLEVGVVLNGLWEPSVKR